MHAQHAPIGVKFLASFIFVLLPLSALAQYTNSQSFATRSVRGRDVLHVQSQLDIPSTTSIGIAKVTISTRNPSNADRDLIVVFYLKSYGQGAENFAYRVPVRLAEGKSSVEVEIPHIRREVQAIWDVGLFEDGRDIEDRRGQRPGAQNYQWIRNNGQQLLAFAALYSSRESPAPVIKQMQILSDALIANPDANRNSTNPITGVQAIPITAGSGDWRRYFPYSAWTLSIDAVRELSNYPEIAEAIRIYVAAGGVLLVHTADGTSDQAAVDAILVGADSPQAADWGAFKAPKPQWWRLDSQSENSPQGSTDSPSNSSAVGELSGLGAAHDAAVMAETWLQGSLGSHLGLADEVASLLGQENSVTHSLDEPRSQIMRALSTEKMFSRQYVFGAVFITSRSLADAPRELLRQSPFASNRATSQISSGSDGNWFWRNLIQAVGKPPVWMFCAMVTLFGALLGPGLLFFTGRIGRRSLMIILVPAISLVATTAIVLYGILHEGFETHLRVTSVQMIDADTKQGFVWSRQNYFSGLPPRDGLTFARDTYARPVYADDERMIYPSNPNPRAGVNCNVTLSDKQNWRGWLRPRQQQQLLVGHPMRSPTLPISIGRSDSGDVTVRNLTDSVLPIVLFRGGGDDYYFAKNLLASEQAVVAADKKDSVAAYVANAIVDYRPTAPVELQEGGSLLDFGTGRSRYNLSSTLNEADDVVNVYFKQYMSEKLELPRFGFSVLTTQSDAVEVPLVGRGSENLHLIMGVEPW